MRLHLVSLLLAAATASTSRDRPTRPCIRIDATDKDRLRVVSDDPISQIYIDGMYENTDYMLDVDPRKRCVHVRMLTERGPLVFEIETDVPKTNGLLRRHRVVALNPNQTRRR